ncbi:MAG: ypdA 5, partial [Bacteroidetes bacterium]|nr:ypdA 5 [Bacteroidota bacterium]
MVKPLKPICLFVYIFLSGNLFSQFYQMRNFNAENGLPSPEVYGMLQDSKGYMWFATDMGVSRYDGNEFKNYSTENGLPDNTVFGFCEDLKGRIWLRSFSGKLSYFLNDSVHTLPCNLVLEKEIRKHALVLTSIFVDEADTVWVGTTSKIILKIAPQWKEKNVSWISLPENGEYMYLINEKALVFGGNETKAPFITVYKKSLEQICQINSTQKTAKRYFATRLKDGTFLTSVNNTILKFTKDGLLAHTKQNATIIALLEDKDNKIISASYDGIHIHNEEDLNSYESIPDFSDKIFTAIVIDKENSLWLSTEGHGVYYIPFREGRYYTSEHGFTQSKISCIDEIEGNIITGHLNGGVSIIKGNEIKTVSLKAEKMDIASSNRINCIYIHNKTDVYVGNSQGTFKLHKTLEGYEVIDTRGVKKIIKSKGNIVWLLRARMIMHC